jgi:hypothetical protein
MRKLVFILIAFIAAATLVSTLNSGSSPGGIAAEAPVPDIDLSDYPSADYRSE